MGIPENINLGRKGRFGQVNINAFKDGVKKTDIENKDHVKIFDKFDKDKNGVLSEDELQELVNSLGTYAQDGKITRREAGKFLKSNGLKGELKKKEVFDFLKQYGIASDNIADTTSLLSADGIELLNIEYNPNDAGETITEMINQENGALYGKKIVKDGKTVTQYFSADGKVTKETFEENGVTTIKNYDENGNVTSTIRKKGSVTEYLNEQGQITRKETDKGNGIKETIDYEYDDSGNLTKSTTTNPDGSKVITEGQTVTTLNTDGSKTVENSQTGITQEFDKDGNIIKTTTLQEDGSKVVEDDKTITTINTDGTSTVKDKETGDVKEFDKEGKPVPYKHQTQLGDTWYGIVQAKYGITDHNQTMEIVHRLKRQNNVDFNATNMPQEILLPDTVTLKDGTEVKLANKDAKVDTSHNNITNPNHSYNLKTEPEDLEAEIREQAEKNEAVRKEGTEIAAALYKDMKGIGTSKTFSSNLERITKDNAAAVVLGYREVSNDESLTEAILDEVGMSKSNRREALQGIFNKLVEKAKEQGIDTTHFEEQFNSQINSATTWGSDKFDPIFEGLASGINGASILTSEDITDIQSMSAAEQKDYAVDQLDNVTESSRESFENQLATDGWAGKTVDWMSGLWGSENRKKFVEEDLKTFEAQVDQLRSAKTEEEFKAKFKEIFGTEFNPNMIRAYEKRQNQLVLAKATYGIEQNFNTTVKNLLENDTLSEEYQYVQTSSGQYGSSGSYIVSATKEQVFARDFNAFAEFVGQGDIEAGKAELNQAMADAGLDLSKATQEEKYTAIHNLAKTYSQTLHNNTLAATENKGFEAFNNECETMYNAAFGTTNDIARRVQDYNTSQQVGAMVLKSGVKAAGAIGLCLIPGVGLVAASVGTAAISATVDASDRMSSKIGLQEGELQEILKNATIDGATVFAGGQLTKALSSASSFVKMGGQMTGDIIVGAAAEKLQTGQITLGGVAFQTVFSGAGNLVALKQLKNVDANAPKADIPPEVEPLRPRDIVADGEVARNIDVSHVDANQRRMVQDAVDEVPSQADIAAYRKSLGEAPTPEEQALIDVNNAQAAAANAKAHQIGENLSDDVIKRLLGGEIPESVPSSVRPEIKKLTDEINGIDGTIKNLEQRIQGAKRMHKDTQALETQLGALQQRRTAKLAELETAMKDVPPVPETPVTPQNGAQPAARDNAGNLTPKAAGSIASRPDLDKYKLSAGKQYGSIDEMEFALKLSEKYNYSQGSSGSWSSYHTKNPHSAWKMHLYSVDQTDYQKMADVILPYLRDHGIEHKCLGFRHSIEEQSSTIQAGKAFTVYPKSSAEMEQIARDLDYIIKNNNLAMSNSHITGDNNLGDSGRLFYRYEYKSKSQMNDILDLNNEQGYDNYRWNYYDSNRGENGYLASDMTPADDPWLNFNPADINSKPEFGKVISQAESEPKIYETPKSAVNNADDIQAIIVAQPGERLVKSAPVAVEPDAKLVLAGQYELDLASSEISARLRNLKEGETLTVGRTGDIQVPEYMTSVSRNHLEITKQNGKIIVKDVSSNGTKIKDISINNNMQVFNSVDQSIKFNQTHKVPAGEKVLDGYKDGGRGLKFDSDGNPINAPTREIIVVNRQKDKNLQEMISDIKKKTAKMSDKEKAAFLQKYIYAKTGKGNVAEKNCNAWDELNIGREVLLGDIITNKPPVAVCRHRSLLYKILGDEIGLKVELQRGNFINEWGGGGHAWNTVRFDDGTSAIFDAMHNKTSNTTPGHVDDYAKYYFTVKKQPLYENGL